MPNPWFRLYDEVVDDPKVQLLSDRLFKAWINFMCIANKGTPRGTLPEIKQIAYRLHVTPIRAEGLAGELVAVGLFEWKDGFLYTHNWNGRQFQSDDSTERVKRFRNGQCNVSETPDVTDQIQNRTEAEADKKASPSEKPKKSNQVPRDFTVSDANRLWARNRGLNDSVITEETAAFMDHEFKNARTDWPAAWRNWLRNKDKYQGNGNGKQHTIETRGDLLIRRQKEELDRALRGATGDDLRPDDHGGTDALVRARAVGSDG